MHNVITAERDQVMLLAPSINEWLPEDHLAVFVADVVERLDLTRLEEQYRGSGKASYSPSLLLGLLFYGYATGVFSSRKIEVATYDSVAFRYLAGNTHPDHDTIAAFRRRFIKQLKALFVQILLLAKEMGFAKLGTVAIDGTKVKANASKHKAMSWKYAQRLEKQLKEEIKRLLHQAEAADRQDEKEDVDIPEEIRIREKRLAKIEEAKRAIEERARQRHEQIMGQYRERLRRREQQRERTGRSPGGKAPQPPDFSGPEEKEQHNFTDADSRIMKSNGGFEQCFNAQAAVDVEDMLIVGTSLSNNAADSPSLRDTLESIEVNTNDRPGAAVADAGYMSEENVSDCAERGIDPYFAVGRDKHNMPLQQRLGSKARTPKGLSRARKDMWKKVHHEFGKEIYRIRKSTVEPVFGIIKEVMGFRRFMLRGMEKVTGEWDLVCLAYDIRRLYSIKPA
jgi:transposase